MEEINFDAEVTRLENAQVECWKNNSSEGSSYYFRGPDGYKLEIHSHNLETRLDSIRSKPYTGWSYPEKLRISGSGTYLPISSNRLKLWQAERLESAAVGQDPPLK